MVHVQSVENITKHQIGSDSSIHHKFDHNNEQNYGGDNYLSTPGMLLDKNLLNRKERIKKLDMESHRLLKGERDNLQLKQSHRE
jgi:hypothetical protein